MSMQFYLKLALCEKESFTRLSVQPLNTFLPQTICDLVLGYLDLTVLLTLFDILRNWNYPHRVCTGFKLVISRRRQYVRILFYRGVYVLRGQISVAFAESLLTSGDTKKIATTLQVIYLRLCNKKKIAPSLFSDLDTVAKYITSRISEKSNKQLN